MSESATPTPNPAPAATPAPAPAAAASPAPAPAPVERKSVKTRLPYQRSCNEKDEKGKLCAGHLKRWYGFGDDIKRQYGENAEIYRCEFCRTVYLPAPGYESRSGTLQF
jgi:hypothetical protein